MARREVLFGEVEDVCLGPEAKMVNQAGKVSLTLGDQLTELQQVRKLEWKFEEVFSMKPGRTNRVKHRIKLLLTW